MAVLFSVEHEVISVPPEVIDLDSFREWFQSDSFPTEAKVIYFDGNVMVEQVMERILHSEIKSQLHIAIGHWANQHGLGKTHCDRMRLTHRAANLSVEPDILFYSHASKASGLVQLTDGDATIEIVGSPDLIVEVVSNSSGKKDEQILPKKYWQAGVKEYWIVDSRKSPVLTIFKRGKRGFVAVTEKQGWLTSEVLSAQCRLKTSLADGATTDVTLEMKPAR
jgi:Uma2 family endonuclease